MIKRIFFIASLFVLIIGCSNLEFVYNSSFQIMNKIKENTLLSISGDNRNIINSYLLNRIGKAGNNPAYALSIVSNGVIEAVQELGLTVPVVVRLEGTNADIAKEILSNSKVDIIPANDLKDAAEKVVNEAIKDKV